MKRKGSLLAIILLSMALLTACGGGGNRSYDYESTSVNSNYAGAIASTFGKADISAAGSGLDTSSRSADTNNSDDYHKSTKKSNSDEQSGRKIIRTVDMTIQTGTKADIEAIMAAASEKCNELGGYEESRSIDGYRKYYGDITLRVPKSNTDEFLEFINDSNLVITKLNDNSKDVTLQYTDVDSRLGSAKRQQKKYEEYAEKAENMDDLLRIEERLDSVTADLESYQSQMNTLNNQIDYCTVSLDIESKEKVAYSSNSFSEQFADNMYGFGEDLADIVTGIISAAIVVVLGAIGFIPAIIIFIFTLRFVFKFKVKDLINKFRTRRNRGYVQPRRDTSDQGDIRDIQGPDKQ